MSISRIMLENLDEFFPAPSLPPSRLAPQRLPGANAESLATVQDVLKDNHQRYHIFLNNMGFHNHITHRALAIYALGGSAATVREYYNRDSERQRPAFDSPEPITEDNFVEHLGNENFYQAYVSFFSKQVSEKGAGATLEEFIFSEKYNFRDGRDANAQPVMFTRFYASLLHALIHVGHGAEFGLKGMLVEGLALAAMHNPIDGGPFTPSFFTSVPENYSADRTSTLPPSLVLEPSLIAGAANVSITDGVHVFDIVARMLKDDRFDHMVFTDYMGRYAEVLNQYKPIIKEYAEKWTIDIDRPGEVERKMEEVVWLSSLLYGVGGLTRSGFRSHFFLMHLVTSSLFLPSLIAYLSPRAQVLLLRGYLLTALTWWIISGQPALNVKSFMTTTSVQPSVPTTPASGRPLTTETTSTPNPFLPILQSAITHPEDHVVKIQRTFAHFDTLYGTRPAGYFEGTELEGAELLDGSFFLRAALLTANYVGWVREGKEARPFSLEGFYT